MAAFQDHGPMPDRRALDRCEPHPRELDRGELDRREPGPHALRPHEPLWRHLVGELLRRRRHERGETLDEVAERAGLSPQYLSEIERGRKEPSSEMVQAVIGALDLTLLDLTLTVARDLAASQPRRVGPAPSAPHGARGTIVALAA